MQSEQNQTEKLAKLLEAGCSFEELGYADLTTDEEFWSVYAEQDGDTTDK